MQPGSTRQESIRVFRLIVDAPPERFPDQWANENRVLPAGSAEPGPMRMSRTPYVVPIGRAFSIPTMRRISFMMARQMAKTNGVMFNVMGQRLDDDPTPMLYVGPTQSNIDDVIEPKITEMLENSPTLWEKTARGQENKKHAKRVSGVSLRLAWAGSSTQLKADSAGLGFVDEIDGIEADMKKHGEGSTVDMVEAITSTFPEGKVGLTSTPTEGYVETCVDERTGIEHWAPSDTVTSAIWKHWQEGSRHEWAWPCPHCLEYFVPRFKLLIWPDGANPVEAEDEAGVTCSKCGSLVNEMSRTWMNDRGVMVSPGQQPLAYDSANGSFSEGGTGVTLIDHADNGKKLQLAWGDFHLPGWSRGAASFWVSGLATFSAKKTWGFIAGKFLRAVRSLEHERLQGVYNTDLGELYRVSGEAPKWDTVLACTGVYTIGMIPEDIKTITAGVDVQKNRLVYAVRGWADGFTSYLIEHGELWGDTDQPMVWTLLSDLLHKDFDGLPISKMSVDSGYRRDEVYHFCRMNKPIAVPTKGHDRLDKPYYASLVDVNFRGKVIKNGLQLWHVDSDVMKSWVHARIDWPKDQDGVWLLPSDIDEDYCKQIIAEQRVVKPSGQVTWVQVSKDNHFLDAEALAYLAVRIGGISKRNRRGGKKSKPKAKKQPASPSQFGSNEWNL